MAYDISSYTPPMYCVKEKHCAGVRFTAQGEAQTCEWQTGVC